MFIILPALLLVLTFFGCHFVTQTLQFSEKYFLNCFGLESARASNCSNFFFVLPVELLCFWILCKQTHFIILMQTVSMIRKLSLGMPSLSRVGQDIGRCVNYHLDTSGTICSVPCVNPEIVAEVGWRVGTCCSF